MRRFDARTTVLGLLAATRVTIDAAYGRLCVNASAGLSPLVLWRL